jgi:hypothetical protein
MDRLTEGDRVTALWEVEKVDRLDQYFVELDKAHHSKPFVPASAIVPLQCK